MQQGRDTSLEVFHSTMLFLKYTWGILPLVYAFLWLICDYLDYIALALSSGTHLPLQHKTQTGLPTSICIFPSISLLCNRLYLTWSQGGQQGGQKFHGNGLCVCVCVLKDNTGVSATVFSFCCWFLSYFMYSFMLSGHISRIQSILPHHSSTRLTLRGRLYLKVCLCMCQTCAFVCEHNIVLRLNLLKQRGGGSIFFVALLQQIPNHTHTPTHILKIYPIMLRSYRWKPISDYHNAH